MKILALDSQLLLLLIVGNTRRDYISKHKRLKAYTEADFDLLVEFLSKARDVVVTPNTLTEASNLLGYSRDPMRTELFKAFADLLPNFQEYYVQSGEASHRQEFVRLGLADVVMLEVSKGDRMLLTADLGLYLAAEAAGMMVLNFNHEREARGIV